MKSVNSVKKPSLFYYLPILSIGPYLSISKL